MASSPRRRPPRAAAHDGSRPAPARSARRALARQIEHRIPGSRLPRDQALRAVGAIADQIAAEIFLDLRRAPRRAVGDRVDDRHWRAGSAASLPDRSPHPARSIRPRSPPRERASAPPAHGAPASHRLAVEQNGAGRPRRCWRSCRTACAAAGRMLRRAASIGSSGWLSKSSFSRSRIAVSLVRRIDGTWLRGVSGF